MENCEVKCEVDPTVDKFNEFPTKYVRSIKEI